MANLNLRGEAFRLNKVTTAGEQTDVQITALKNGAFIAVWTDSSATGDDASGRAIRGRLFDADGNPLGEERVLNTSTAGNQSEPTVAALDDGRFVVAWTDRSGSADPDIRAQIFEADGQKRGSEILVNNGVAGKQSIASVTALAGGGFAVTYGQMSGSSEYDVRTRSFINTQTGLEISDDVIVPQNSSGQQWSPQIVGLSDGYAVVHTDQFGAPVKGRFFSNGGVPGATFDVPSGNAQIALAALEGPDGTKDRFLMTWTSYANNGLNTPTGIRALIVDKFGNKTEIGNDGTAGDGFLIAAGAVSFSAVTALPGGGFAVAYLLNQGSVHVAAFDGQGQRIVTPDGTDLLVRDNAAYGADLWPSITVVGGQLVVSWTQKTYDSATGATTSDVHAQFVSLNDNHNPTAPSLTPSAHVMGGTGDAADPFLIDETVGAVAIGTAASTDTDPGAQIRYALVNDHEGRFAIHAETGELRVANAAKLPVPTDTDYGITIRVSDGQGGSSSKTYTIRVKNNVDQTNDSPVIGSASAAGNGRPGSGEDNGMIVVRKESGAGVIAQVSAHDPDGDALTYALGDGSSHDGLFSIGADGKISVADASKLPSAGGTYTLTVLVGDGAVTTAKDVQVRVKANQNPTDVILSKFTVAENAAAGTDISALNATDPDAGDTFAYSLLDDAGGRFAIQNGWLVVKDGTKLDFETAKSHEIKIQVTDSAGGTFAETFTISVSDVYEVQKGTMGRDTITVVHSPGRAHGGGGHDVIFGSFGNDILWGGTGNDRLTGGKGKDAFAFDAKANRKTNFDKITDFSVKDDSLWFDDAVFKKLGKGSELKPGKMNKAFFTVGPKAKDKNDYLVYDNKKGVLFYDEDGSGAKKAVEVAALAKNLKMTAGDFFVI